MGGPDKQQATRLRMNRHLLAAALLAPFLLPLALPKPAAAIDLCHGGNRAERKLTCIVDGDTGWQKGHKWRLVDIDAPEVSHPECENEKRLGKAATERLRSLMSKGYTLEGDGSKGRYQRDLVKVILSDGRDAGEVLIHEGLAQKWPNKGNTWCDR